MRQSFDRILVRTELAGAPGAAYYHVIRSADRKPPGRGLRPRRPGARYRVRDGDSLWAIAVRQLGERATMPRTVALACLLWQLNAARVGTGGPDVLPSAITIAIPKQLP